METVGCECQLKIKYFRERMDCAREKAFSPNSETTEETPETQEKREALRLARVVGGRAGATLLPDVCQGQMRPAVGCARPGLKPHDVWLHLERDALLSPDNWF